jgi:hypothetical protein
MNMAYNVDLPADLKGHSIDTAHPLFKSFEADAVARGMSQEAFTAAITAYARGATGKAAPAAPAPAPAAPGPAAPRNWDSLSTREQFAHSLTVRSHRG